MLHQAGLLTQSSLTLTTYICTISSKVLKRGAVAPMLPEHHRRDTRPDGETRAFPYID